MNLTRCYRIVDYIGEFYVQYQDFDDYTSIPDDAWEELSVVKEDTPSIEAVRDLLRECVRLNQSLHSAQEMVALKQEAIAALLEAQDSAQAEIKRLQGLLDKK